MTRSDADEAFLDTMSPVGRPYRDCTPEDLKRCEELLRTQKERLRGELEALVGRNLPEGTIDRWDFDPAATAVLNLVVQTPIALPGVFRFSKISADELALILDVEGVLDGLGADAGRVAAAVVDCCCFCPENAATVLRTLACETLRGWRGPVGTDGWDDHHAAALALHSAAHALDMWVSK